MRQTAQKLKLFASKPLLVLLVLTPVLLFGTGSSYFTNDRVAAATAGTINFQARLMTNTGAIAADGDYNVEFKLYDALTSSGSSQGSCTGDAHCLWTETRTSGNVIHVANGYISANLGSVTSFPTTINWDQDVWLTMNIGGTGTPSWDGEMSPRLKLTAVPYAFRAGQLASLAGSNTGVLKFVASLGQATTITLPDPGAGTANVCYQGSSSCGFATGTAGSYIQNGLSQQTANFNIIGNNTANPTAQIQGIASGTKPVLQLLGGSTPGSGEDILNLQDSTATNTFFKVDNTGLATLNKGLNVVGATVNINASSNNDTNINTGSSTGNVNIGNGAAGTLTLQSASTIAISTTNFNVSTAGVVTLAGNQTSDVTTAASAGGAANGITIIPGSSGGASSNGATVTIKGSAASGTTSVTGGGVTINGGNATGGSGTRNGGSITIDAGTGASSNGSINIGTNVGGLAATASNINIGGTGASSPINSGKQTVNIGINNTSGSTTDVVVGSGTNAAGGATTLRAKTTVTLSSGSSTTIGTVSSGTASTGSITLQSGDATTGSNLSAGAISIDTGTHTGSGTGLVQIGNTNATAVQIGSGSNTTSVIGTINLNNNSNNITNINTGTSTGAVNIGNSTSGILTLQGGNGSTVVINNGAGNSTTLNFTAPSGTNTITFPAASGTVQLAPTTGGYIQQVPTTTLINTIAPTAASVVALTVKGTTGTAAHVIDIFNSAGSPTLQDYFDANGLLNVGQIIQPTANNTIDLGTSSAAFRTGYFGTSVVTPAVVGVGTNTLNIDTGGVAAINIGVNGTSVSGITVGNTTSNPNVAFNGSGTFGTTTGQNNLNGTTVIAANKNFSLSAGTGTIAQTFSAAAAGNAQTLGFANTNTGAGIAIQGVNITPTNTSTATSGTNQLNLINFAAGGALGGTDNTNCINFASATGYTNFIKTPTFVLNSAGAISGVTTYNGLALTSAADGFTVAGGTTQRTLTVTGADITIGSTIKPTSAGALTVQANGSNSLSLTAGAASTWDIGNNLLSLQTTNNGQIQTGTGLWTQGGNITFGGSTARTITGPGAGGLTITDAGGPLALSTTTSGTLSLNSAGALNFTGAAASTWTTGSATLALQSANFNVAATGQVTLTGGLSPDITTAVTSGVAAALTLQPGTATGANNGATVTLQGGTAGGTGVKGLIQLNGATYYTTGSYSSGSTATITQSLIDSNSAILATATATTLTFTVPSPTVTTASGRIIYISNVGTNPFTLAGAGTSFTLNSGSTATLLWNGSAWTSAGVDASTLQNVYNNSSASPTPEIVLDGTRHGFDIQDANTTIGSTEALLAVRASATATTLGNGLFVVNASGKIGINLSSTATNPTISNDLSFGAGANRTIGVEAQSASNTAGNNITLAAGAANGTGAGGNTVLQGGLASATAGSNGGGITLTAAAGSVTGTGGAGGAVTIQGGSAGGSGNNNGGGVSVVLGASTGTGTQGTFQVQNALGASLLTVDPSNTAASLNLISNGGAETGSPPTGFAAQGSGSSVAAGTGTDAASGTQSAKVTFGTTTLAGTKISFATAPTASTTVNYIVSFSAKQVSGTAVAPGNTALQVLYSPDNGTTLTATCSNYSSSASLSTTAWTKVSCTFIPGSTTVTTALLIIRQADTPGVSRVIDIDNVSVVQQNSSGATDVGDLKVGGATSQGLTLFTLDTYSATPFSGSNASLAGSMYFDTTQSKIQCYDGSNWGACGAAPNTIVTLTPEYAGAVLDSAGVSTNIGTMTSDFCANSAALTVGTLCSSGDARNFYKWTSPQGSLQSYSIFVTYKLPSTFKSFVAGSTSLTGLVDNTTNASVKYAVFKSTGSAVTSCSATATVVGAGTGSANTWTTGVAGTLSGSTDPSTCGFVAGNNIIFQITVQADNNASAYPENLNFQYGNQ